MKQINTFLNKYPELREFDRFIDALYGESEIKGMFLCGSRAKQTNNIQSTFSDFDFFAVTSEKISKIQSLHYHIKDSRLELMLYEENKFTIPSSYDVNLLSKLLNKAELVFSKNKNIKEQFIKFANMPLKKGTSESEMESMWFKLIWNVLKVKSYEQRDPDLAEVFAMQNYFFIGLLYGRLSGEPTYNLAESVKSMREKDFSFWKKYKNVLNKKNKRKEIEQLVHYLPNSEFYLSKKSLIELDNFISPLTVVGDECETSNTYRNKIDKLLLPTMDFLNKD
ncbi:hypothetical protein KO361_03005 [Candidatus Woesearchaeota archaeon]|nr:hypothetical protein [Candidatus Woesearchaeota archaeon]